MDWRRKKKDMKLIILLAVALTLFVTPVFLQGIDGETQQDVRFESIRLPEIWSDTPKGLEYAFIDANYKWDYYYPTTPKPSWFPERWLVALRYTPDTVNPLFPNKYILDVDFIWADQRVVRTPITGTGDYYDGFWIAGKIRCDVHGVPSPSFVVSIPKQTIQYADGSVVTRIADSLAIDVTNADELTTVCSYR